jgi:hypothetical protein
MKLLVTMNANSIATCQLLIRLFVSAILEEMGIGMNELFVDFKKAYDSAAGSCELTNKPTYSIKGNEFLSIEEIINFTNGSGLCPMEGFHFGLILENYTYKMKNKA